MNIKRPPVLLASTVSACLPTARAEEPAKVRAAEAFFRRRKAR